MIVSDLEPLAASLDKLSLLPGNPRRGDVDAVARSLDAFGQRKPIVARRDGTVIAGNHTLQAARQLGWDRLAVVWVDDDETTAKAFALADNRTAELGGYDDAELAALIREVGDVDAEMLAATGWGDDAVAALLASLEPEVLPAQIVGDPDDVPDSAPARTVPGDVWLLGPHRLLCGDSTVPTDVDRLMAGTTVDAVFTDPPYGMDLDPDYDSLHTSPDHHKTGQRFDRIVGDESAFDPSPVFALVEQVPEQFWWGADYYRDRLPQGGSWVVWDKRSNDAGMDLDKVLGAQFELCWSRQKHKREIARVLWSGHHGMQREDTKSRVHPTQKPTALVTWFFDRWFKPGAVVLDFFAGSGTTLIAAHQTGRIAYLVELDPRYCDVICKRWQKATGIMPIAESTGRPHDFCVDDG